MYKYYVEGGALFMGMLSIVFLIILALAVVIGVAVFVTKTEDKNKLSGKLGYIKSLGLFAFVLGMLGQFIGLFDAFKAIESGMDITPQLLAGGLRVSSITSIYGMIIFIVAYLIWFGLDVLSKRNS